LKRGTLFPEQTNRRIVSEKLIALLETALDSALAPDVDWCSRNINQAPISGRLIVEIQKLLHYYYISAGLLIQKAKEKTNGSALTA
jgi:hypothetical protein